MPTIAFLDDNLSFSGNDFRTGALGGIQTGTIMLAEEFAKRAHKVLVFNQIQTESQFNGIDYIPISRSSGRSVDIAIASNSANLFRYIKANQKIVWQHNRTHWGRAFKRKEIVSLFRYHPDLVLLSPDAKKNTPRTLPYNHRTIIYHGIEEMFLRPEPAPRPPAGKNLLFASHPCRNFDWVLDIWLRYIHPELPQAEFHVCSPKPDLADRKDILKRSNVIVHGPVSKHKLAEFMQSSRALVYPGHKNETGCQVALQAIGSGLPIITVGYGCLKDQVIHGTTGFVEMTPQQYAERTIQCLLDDQLWMNLHRNTLSHPWRNSWATQAKKWESILFNFK